MADIPANILASLVCSKCNQILKRGPVYQLHNGAAVCSLCPERDETQPAVRCLLYELTAQLLRFPCRYQEKGCQVTVPFVAVGSTEFNHEDVCEYWQHVCPVLGSNHCNWEGRWDRLLYHCQEEHPDRVFPNPVLINPDIHQSQMTDCIIHAFNNIFLVHTRVCLRTSKLHYSVRLLGNPQNSLNYYFTVTIQWGEDTITRTRDVLPQELLAFEEHSAMNFNIDHLLRLLGSWDGVSLSLEVKVRETAEMGAEGQAEQEKCSKCGARTTRLYRDQRGWLCVKCAPRREICLNNGCEFQDIGTLKREKHSKWFCQWSTKCIECRSSLQPGKPWQQHYTTCTKFKLIPSGCGFVARCNNGVQTFLVETASGYMVCWCYYTKITFSLSVYVPVPCKDLCGYQCEVRLDCAGDSRTHTPLTLYDMWYDWEVVCQNDNFFTNSEVFVTVKVNKIK